MSKRPRILVTLDIGSSERRGVQFPNVHLKQAYLTAVEKAGGTPIGAGPTLDKDTIEDLAQLMDGLLVTGGAFDIDPSRYGATKRPVRLDATLPLRTDFEWTLTERALSRRIPIFGVCGGMQLLSVVLGGDLFQDIEAEFPGAIDHEQPSSPTQPFHPVEVVAGTPLATWTGQRLLQVNTTHHQALDRLGEGLEVWAKAPDGVIEAVGMSDRPEVYGVQWHPELLADPVSDALYAQLVEAAIRVKK